MCRKMKSESVVLWSMIWVSIPNYGSATESIESLEQKMELLQDKLQQIQLQLDEQKMLKEKIEKVATEQARVTASNKKMEEKDSVVHLAGYGAAGYTDNEAATGRFSGK